MAQLGGEGELAKLELPTAPVPLSLSACPKPAEALSYLGYAGQAMDAEMAARLERAVSACDQLSPRGMFRVFALEAAPANPAPAPANPTPAPTDPAPEPAPESALRLASAQLALPGNDIARHLEGAAAVALLAVTLGYESERLIRRETSISPVDGMFVDAMASSTAESAMEELHAQLAAWARERGLHVGARFSPGYGDLSLEMQPAFLKTLGADKTLGISTTDACLLVPSKSITAVVGLFAEGIGEGDSACSDEGANATANATTSANANPGTTNPTNPCATCDMAPYCLIKQQGRTCHGGTA